MKIEVDTDFRGAVKRVKRIQAEILNEKGRLYKDIGIITAKSIVKNFGSEGRPGWRVRKYDYSHPILDRTGTMRDRAEQSTQNWHKTSHGWDLDIITVFYGAIHQLRGILTNGVPIIRKFARLTTSEIEAVRERIRKVFYG